MKKHCNFCGVLTVNPCKDFVQLAGYVADGRPLTRCRDAHEAHVARLRHPSEDAFALPQNGHHSETAKAQIALGALPGAFGAPTPFMWSLMQGDVKARTWGKSVADQAREVEQEARNAELRATLEVLAQPDAREAAIEAKRQRLIEEGAKIEWLGDYPSPARPAVSRTEGVKFDNGKLRFDLIPPDALALLAAVLTYGAAKYEDRNWELGMDRARLRAARSRHENARLLGIQMDSETGLPHLAHEAACTMMELALWLRGKGTDSGAKLEHATLDTVEAFSAQAVEAGRIAAAKKGAQHG